MTEKSPSRRTDKKHGLPYKQVGVDSLQKDLNKWLKTEGPKIDAFVDLLTTQASLLREGKINERVFFERLTASKEPIKFMFKSLEKESERIEWIDVERTAKGEIKVGTRQVGAWPQLTATIGLSKDGHLETKTGDIDARYVDPDGIVKPHIVKEDNIRTDVIDVSNLGGTPKEAAGNELIVMLKNVVPFESKHKAK